MTESSEVSINIAVSDSDSSIPPIPIKNQNKIDSKNENKYENGTEKDNKESINRDNILKNSNEKPSIIQKNLSDSDEIGPKVSDTDEEQSHLTSDKIVIRPKQAYSADGLTSVDEESKRFVDTEGEPQILHPNLKALASKKAVPQTPRPTMKTPRTKTCILI